MYFSDETQREILNKFPFIVPSYQNIHNKKVHSIYIAIPKGKKSYIWFTFHNDNPICLMLTLSFNKTEINNIIALPACFNKKISYGKGTILYGTFLNIDKLNIFVTEDITLFNGNNISRQSYSNKLELFSNLFNNYIDSHIFTNTQLIFTLPLIHKNYYSLIRQIETNCNYNIYSIQQRTLNGNMVNENKYSFNEKITLYVGAEDQNDIYSLYISNKENIGTACINDYKSSVMMNNIFRNIKENKRLDTLEESDDDDDFENINNDKYVKQKNLIRMECIFNKKFNKWQPIKISHAPVSNDIRKIKTLEKNFDKKKFR
jgi:hypothetical protein